jgi:signal peptidase I
MTGLVAFIVSLILPGTPHAAYGRTWRGALWVGIGLTGLLAANWVGPAAVLLVVVCCLGAAIDICFLRRPPRLRWIHGLVFLVVTGTALSLVRRFVIEAYKLPSGGMIPTFQVGDHVFVDHTSARHPHRGEVVVYRRAEQDDTFFVKRVVALGGDTVELRGRTLYVNGAAVPERVIDADYRYWDHNDEVEAWVQRPAILAEEMLDGVAFRVVHNRTEEPARPGRYATDGPYQVPAGMVFFLGDNRENSNDSRFTGPVPAARCLGRAAWIWWSQGHDGPHWDRIGRVH